MERTEHLIDARPLHFLLCFRRNRLHVSIFFCLHQICQQNVYQQMPAQMSGIDNNLIFPQLGKLTLPQDTAGLSQFPFLIRQAF